MLKCQRSATFPISSVDFFDTSSDSLLGLPSLRCVVKPLSRLSDIRIWWKLAGNLSHLNSVTGTFLWECYLIKRQGGHCFSFEQTEWKWEEALSVGKTWKFVILLDPDDPPQWIPTGLLPFGQQTFWQQGRLDIRLMSFRNAVRLEKMITGPNSQGQWRSHTNLTCRNNYQFCILQQQFYIGSPQPWVPIVC